MSADHAARLLVLGLLFVLGCNVVCLYGLVRVLWADFQSRRPPPRTVSYDPDDYGDSLRRAIAARGSNTPKV